MAMPKGMEVKDNDGNLCIAKLKRPIYGLKQSARNWNTKLNDVLLKIGYKRSKFEPCLYIKGKSYILVYVDDVVIVTATDKEANRINTELKKQFTVTGGNTITSFLGMKIKQSKDKIKIEASQEAFIPKKHLLNN